MSAAFVPMNIKDTTTVAAPVMTVSPMKLQRLSMRSVKNMIAAS
jgi:hypothetical protein